MIFFRALLIFLFSTPVMLGILAIEQQAQVVGSNALNKEQINDIQQLLIDHDPRLLLNTNNQVIELSSQELDALFNYFKGTVPTLNDAAIETAIQADNVNLTISLPVRPNPFGQYLNISILALQSDNFLKIETIEIGALHIPPLFIQVTSKIITQVLHRQSSYGLFDVLLNSIQSTSLEQDKISVILDWQSSNLSNIQNQARQVFIDQEEITLITHYYNLLAGISHSFPDQVQTLSLNEFLRPLFSEAIGNDDANPQIENRAIFTALTIYLTDLGLEDIIGPYDEDSVNSPKSLKVKIGTRNDIAQHMVGSAAIASSAGVGIANILSVYKEVHDSRYRTGFSFTDLTANKVGTLLGQLSDENASTASQVQNLMSKVQLESDYMPNVNVYDGMTEQEFIAAYDNRESEQYKQRNLEIDQEILQRPFFQNFNSNPSLE